MKYQEEDEGILSKIGSDGDEFTRKPYFPISYLQGFLELLKQNKKDIKIITYNDLAWPNGEYDFQESCRREYKLWNRDISQGKLDPGMIYVLLQHDIDARPDRAKVLLELENKYSIPSNIMIFRKRINREVLRVSGKIEFTRYDIDHIFLQDLVRYNNFVVGYHSNVMERASYKKKLAEQIFIQDIKELRHYHTIEYYSPHGGVPGPSGGNNRDILPPHELSRKPRWVHNGCSPSFSGNFTDGGINSFKVDADKRDLRKFVRSWKRGHRYRVLIHPQYYGNDVQKSPRLRNIKWYEELLTMNRNNENKLIWENIYPEEIKS